MLHPSKSAGAAWDIASERAGYGCVCELLSRALGRQVVYRPVGPLRFALRLRAARRSTAHVLISLAAHWLPRVSRPPPLSADFEKALRRRPRGLQAFVEEHAAEWARPGAPPLEASVGGPPSPPPVSRGDN
jgi:hypothetical protein